VLAGLTDELEGEEVVGNASSPQQQFDRVGRVPTLGQLAADLRVLEHPDFAPFQADMAKQFGGVLLLDDLNKGSGLRRVIYIRFFFGIVTIQWSTFSSSSP